ncbi:MAG TPA: multiheme c-type cytochrome [Acidisarcina sp.]
MAQKHPYLFTLKAPATRLWPVVPIFISLFCISFPPALAQSAAKAPDTRAGYVGDAACAACHAAQSSPYEHTSHHLTSQLAGKGPDGKNSVLGSFDEGKNLLMIADPETTIAEPGLYFKMEQRDGRYAQTAVTGWGKDLVSRTEAMDIVTGSGVRGQTYLYWRGERLFQLPVSYWTDGSQWINSPGYVNGSADFSRPISPRCLECHATYIRPRSDDPATNRYERQSFVPGISCETCHGPGAAHIAAHHADHVEAHSQSGSAAQHKAQTTTNAESLEKYTSQAILNPAKFSRDRQVDLCALCHLGVQAESVAPVFSYSPGEPLSKYFKLMSAQVVEHPDVHGNQVGLLQRSRCYTSSPTMTCSTCHDVHAPERPAAEYSDRCLTCHQWQSCGMSKTMGHAIASNCIDCHMPVEPTNLIVPETAGRVVRATMRSHWIKIYSSAK